jgi:adenine-specific DNA methylase
MARSTPPRVLSVLRHLDVEALNDAVRSEVRARQHYLPPVSVYRWWARRTEAVTGAVIDAVGADSPGRLLIADPFAGGGVIALAGVLRGHRVYTQDVNPWAARGLATMLSLPAPYEIAAAGERLHGLVADLLAKAYSTIFEDGSPAAVSHTMRVATGSCPGCGEMLRLYPAALVSLVARIDAGGATGYLACPAGHLNLASATRRTSCETCGRYVKPDARYTAGRTARCVGCGWTGAITELAHEGLGWEVVLVERAADGWREIAPPTKEELRAADPARWNPRRQLPAIEAGVETSVLLNYGMRHWHDLYPKRQRVVLEALFDACGPAARGDERVANALRAAVIGSTEMAGFGSRWDAGYLKSYEAIANHRFNFTTFSAEPNVWGISEAGRGTVERRLEHIAKASSWLEEMVGRPLRVEGPVASTSRRTRMAARLDARVVTGSSHRLCVADATLDAVVTDPPYHDDVHYGELSDLFRAWARDTTGALDGDAIVHKRDGVPGTDAYRDQLQAIFTELRRALRPGGHLVLSYANRNPAAWVALFSALEGAGYKAVGYLVVRSENETDHAKAHRRACNLDVLIDLVPVASGPVRRHQPTGRARNAEERFCRLVGRQALEIGALGEEWEKGFTEELRRSRFLASSTR